MIVGVIGPVLAPAGVIVVVPVIVVVALTGRVQHVVEEPDRHPVHRRQRAGRGADPVGRCLDRGGGDPVSDESHALYRVGMDDLLGDGQG